MSKIDQSRRSKNRMKIKQSTISELQWKIHFMKVDYLKSIFMSIQAKTYFQIVISIRERYFLLMNRESVHDIQEQYEILAKTNMLHTNFCAYLAELSFSISVFALFVCNAYLTTKQRVLVYWNCRFEKVKKKTLGLQIMLPEKRFLRLITASVQLIDLSHLSASARITYLSASS